MPFRSEADGAEGGPVYPAALFQRWGRENRFMGLCVPLNRIHNGRVGETVSVPVGCRLNHLRLRHLCHRQSGTDSHHSGGGRLLRDGHFNHIF